MLVSTPEVSSTTSAVLLLWMQAGESWLQRSRPGSAKVLHRLGRGAAAVASVGIALRVPNCQCRTARSGRSRVLQLAPKGMCGGPMVFRRIAGCFARCRSFRVHVEWRESRSGRALTLGAPQLANCDRICACFPRA
jgi:hypothetical protein